MANIYIYIHRIERNMEPQSKRKRRQVFDSHPLPASLKAAETSVQYTGYFTGVGVEIFDAPEMAALHENGCFGIGSHTKSAPAVLWSESRKQSSSQPIKNETLILLPVEAFFLHHSLRCLQIFDLDENILNTIELCETFRKLAPRFIEKYVAYLYLRSKNWVVKCGLKFGGDFRK